ncbi:PucR family transcriptional regulator [Nocardioides cavernaquae]|uniref:PucR family transcriptional regulator n=1 Tax=Nocardioides cavernaquae TaxID=2321396 RepID=A0A3A5H6P8_9ACTN|nr:PucR family transcriptional regulator [Nocardioides cavernaquae]RJS45641.1 PucR family transcriptional regulator [Nocardioides cavernaquae]
MTEGPLAEPLSLTPEQVTALRGRLPRVGEKVVAAVIAEVPSYSVPFQGRMGRTIEGAVTLALSGFLDMAVNSAASGTSGTRERPQQVFDAAYALGRGEARSGRTMDALTAAYRIGTATAWREMSRTAVSHGLPAEGLVRFAELVFDYLDQISAVSVAGHADELARTGRLRERHLSELAVALLAGREKERLEQLAEQAEWNAPASLTAVLLPQSAARATRPLLDPRTLELAGDVEALDGWPDHAVLLVPGRSRAAVLRSLGEVPGVVGPTVPWTAASRSFHRALRALELGLAAESQALVDTETRLAELVVRADPSAHEDLRAQVLAPLADARPAAAEKLTETLRAWLLHQGRRDDIAEALFVHPQTVRYRMGQLREIFGDRLEDPSFVRDATIALS